MHIKHNVLLAIGITVAVFTGCSHPDQTGDKSEKPIIKEVRGDNGQLESRLTIVDNKLHGKVTRFYSNGTVKSESDYLYNKLNGTEKKFYQDGSLYRTREYIEDTLTGIEYRYYRNGQIMTKLEYKNGNPAIGLEEFTSGGRKLTDYPKLKFKIVNERDYKEQILLMVNLDESYKNVRFYDRGLIEGKYFDRKAIPLSASKGVSEKRIDPDFSGEITISCKAITKYRCAYITSSKVIIKDGKIIKKVSL